MATTWTQEGYNAVQPVGFYQMMWGEDPPPVPSGVLAVWEQIADWAYLTTCAAGNGSQTPTATVAGTDNTCTLTAAQIPNHIHNISHGPYNWTQNEVRAGSPNNSTVYTEYNGGDQPHENRPLSYVVTIWVRTF